MKNHRLYFVIEWKLCYLIILTPSFMICSILYFVEYREDSVAYIRAVSKVVVLKVQILKRYCISHIILDLSQPFWKLCIFMHAHIQTKMNIVHPIKSQHTTLTRSNHNLQPKVTHLRQNNISTKHNFFNHMCMFNATFFPVYAVFYPSQLFITNMIKST